MVINDNDSRAARSFTLLHELTHLLLGRTGFAGVVSETEVEEFCNRVAAEWLLPPWALDKIGIERGRDIAEQKQRIGAFARKSNLSRTMVAYRLLRANRLERSTFEHLSAEFREEWHQLRDRRRTRQRESEGGPSYYAVRRHRVGQGLLTFARRLVGSGALSTTKAARILGVKPPHLGKMLRPAQAR
ncbi:MAG: ImmA/IrrE family metallo-endopeptidase [Acidobacteria bacterium]|nr:ImmA/IrrE family metallo-endopeptidase [Acidobacteriota bacterium]